MRVLIFVTLGLVVLFLVRQEAWTWLTVTRFDPVLAGYAALFGAGIVTAELLRPVLSRMPATLRFLAVVFLAAGGWAGADYVLRGTPGDGPPTAGEHIAPTGDGLSPPISGQADADGADGAGGPARVTLQRAWDGRFREVGEINGIAAAMTIDTGAVLVTLPRNEAQRLGLLAGARFDQDLSTDTGTVRAARVTLRSVRIGPVELSAVPAMILDRDAPPEVALGLSFLSRLAEMRLTGTELTLLAP